VERLGADVERELSRFGPQAGLTKLVERWPAAVGEAVARNSWPARFQRDGTLIVHASSSTWAFELAQLESTIREHLADIAPPRIRFVPGPLPEPAVATSTETTAATVHVSDDDASRAADIAAPIADENLRELVARAAAASLAKARSDRGF
jgi:hypothetical protein